MQWTGNAHLVAGGEADLPRLLETLSSSGIKTRGNPDAYVRAYKAFGIEEAREIRARASARAFSDRRIFVLAAPSMTAEAQNALLKTLEEPSGEALFFILTPAPLSFLPTLRSRAPVVALPARAEAPVVDAKKFLAATQAARLDMLAPLLEKDEEDRRDLGATLAFLAALERQLSRHLSSAPAREGLRAVYRARRFIGDKGALHKPLLEQLALLVPSARA